MTIYELLLPQSSYHSHLLHDVFYELAEFLWLSYLFVLFVVLVDLDLIGGGYT